MKRMKGSRTFMALFLAVVMVLGNALAGTYYIEDGDIEVHASETSQTVKQADHTQDDNAPVISNKNPETSSANTVTIKADDGCTTNVTVKDLNIDVSERISTPAVKTEGAGDVNIELDGDSSLKSGDNCAGLQKENTGNLTINDADQNGKLEAEGGKNAAGIGGGDYQAGSNIIINGGEIIATGGYGGAGIGGGRDGNGENITITGGEVTATNSGPGAGIGGGTYGKGKNIKITGGEVTAASDVAGAGIGGGIQGKGENITISGGEVTATGRLYGAGIGGGEVADGTDIKISGGKVIAVGGKTGAGIGGGRQADGQKIEITNNAQVSAAGGAATGFNGAGAAVGDGGTQDGETGAEIQIQASSLTSGGVEYYAPGTNASDIQKRTASPESTVQGSTEHHFGTHLTGNKYTHWYPCEDPDCVARKGETAHTPVTDKGKAATCTETGLTDGSHCSVCGYILTKQETIPARNHTWDTGWTSDGAKHWHKCLNDGCTEIKDEAAHTPGEPVIENEKPARVGKAGSYDVVVCCSVCHRELSRETVTTDPLPEKEDKKMPQGNLAALCAEMAKQIRQAPENGTVEMDAGRFDGLTRVVFKALGERPDVTLKLQTKEGMITIPAGASLLEKIGKKNTVSFTELKDILK